jgi:WG containing repeat
MNQNNFFCKAIAALLIVLAICLSGLNAQVKGVEGKNGKWGLVDATGKMITESIYDNMGNFGQFSEGMLAVWIKNKSGYIDTAGKVILPIKFDECNPFKFGRGTVWLSNKCGLVDKTGKLVVACQYELLTNLNENLWCTTAAAFKKHGIVSKNGKELLPAIYDFIQAPGNTYGILTLKNKKGYYDRDGRITIPCKYDEVGNFQEGIAAVSLNKKWGFVDVSGRMLTAMEYESRPMARGAVETIRKDGKTITYIKPNLLPPLTAKDLINNHIIKIGGQISLAEFKNYQFAVEEFNYKNILYTTTEVFHSGNNISANIYDNNSKQSTKKIMTGGEMWFMENGKLRKDDHETDNVFIYSLPSLLTNAEKMGYTISYDPKKCAEANKIFISIIGKEKLKTEYVFYFTDDYSIKEIEVSRGDYSYSISNIEYKYVSGLLVLSGWSSSALGKDLLIWTKRKDFQLNPKMDPQLFLKPVQL